MRIATAETLEHLALLQEALLRQTRQCRNATRALRCLARALRNPPPLCIDGREYHRRQRCRTKRKGKR